MDHADTRKTWWWNEEVAEAVREQKIKYGKWKRENTKEATMEYKKSRQNAKRVISSARARADPFNGPFSGTTQVSQYQKGKTNLDFTEAMPAMLSGASISSAAIG